MGELIVMKNMEMFGVGCCALQPLSPQTQMRMTEYLQYHPVLSTSIIQYYPVLSTNIHQYYPVLSTNIHQYHPVSSSIIHQVTVLRRPTGS